jgi:hypothetical protein
MGTITRTDYSHSTPVVVVADDAADLLCAGLDDFLLEATKALAAVEYIRCRFPPNRENTTPGFDEVVVVEVS